MREYVLGWNSLITKVIILTTNIYQLKNN